MTPEEQKEEMERCKDPRYFHNKYMQYPGKREITKEEWEFVMYMLYHRPKLKFRRNYR